MGNWGWREDSITASAGLHLCAEALLAQASLVEGKSASAEAKAGAATVFATRASAPGKLLGPLYTFGLGLGPAQHV